MKKTLLLFFGLVVLMTVPCPAAELLVKAKDSWGADDSRSVKGDIIVVRPDGWVWGKEECLPYFLVVKLPGVSVDTVKKFEEVLMDNTNPDIPKMLKRRKYQVPVSWVDAKIALGKSDITINLSAQKTALIESVIEKTK